MALRVLLADESITIKKVMQLALQDFAVEVKSVQSGLDVTEVAQEFAPDIIFVDVLLQKKNGYEVSTDVKRDPGLKKIPVVLMWSSFMELDERLAMSCGAEQRLEKPFDVENLRQLVLELVPKTRSQRLAHFLNFSQNLNQSLQKDAREKTPPPSTPKDTAKDTAKNTSPSNWNMESFDEIEAFSEFKIAPSAGGPPPTDDEEQDSLDISNRSSGSDREPWSHQDLQRFKLDLPPIATTDDNLEVTVQFPEAIAEVTHSVKRSPSPKHAQEKNVQSFENVSFIRQSEIGRGLQPPIELTESSDEAEADHEIPHLEIEEISDDEALSLELAHSERDGKNHFVASQIDEKNLDSGRPYVDLSLPPDLDANQLEQIIRAQSREIIETVVRRVVPDLATRIIREELERLLEESSVREP